MKKVRLLIQHPFLSELTMDLSIQEVQDPIELINNFNPTGIIYDFAVKVGGRLKVILIILRVSTLITLASHKKI